MKDLTDHKYRKSKIQMSKPKLDKISQEIKISKSL